MTENIFNTGVMIFLLAGLVLFSRLKTYFEREDRNSYRYISTGISIVSLMFVLNTFSQLGLFSPIPFLADALFFKLIYWMGNIVGLILLMSGLSTWLPISKQNKRATVSKIMRFDTVKKIDQLLNIETRTPKILATSLDYFINDFNLNFGVVYLFSQKKSKMNLITSSGKNKALLRAIDKFKYNENMLKESEHLEAYLQALTLQLPTQSDFIPKCYPLIVQTKFVGMFILWGEITAAIEEDLNSVLKVSSDLISRRIEKDYYEIKSEFMLNKSKLENSLKNLFVPNDNELFNIIELRKVILEYLDIQFLSITTFNEDNTFDRVSVGSNETILDEHNIRQSSTPAFMRQIIESHSIYVDNNAQKNEYAETDRLFVSGDVKSLAVQPIIIDYQISGMVLASTNTEYYFGSKELSYLNTASEMMAGYLKSRKYSIDKNKYEDNLITSLHFSEMLNSCLNTEEIFNYATMTIFRTVNPTIVRIALYDDDHKFMTSVTLQTSDNNNISTPPGGTMILSLLPIQKEVFAKNKMVTFDNSSSKKITEAEASQVFTVNVKSGVIAPIKIGNDLIGTISVGSNSVGYFSKTSRKFIESIAVILSDSLTTFATRAIDRQIFVSQLSNRSIEVKKALSGLMGSVEFLKKRDQSDNDVSTHLNLIDKSAAKLTEIIDYETAEKF